MKYWLSFLLFSLISFSLIAQKKLSSHRFIIKGKITGVDSGFVHLIYYNDKGERVFDSSRIDHGAFAFIGIIKEPANAVFYSNKKSRGDELNITDFYLEPGNIQIAVGVNMFKQARITGSYTQTEYEQYNVWADSLMQSWKGMWDSLDRARDNNDTTAISAIEENRLPAYQSQEDDLMRDFIRRNPSSYVSGDLLYGQSFHVVVDTIEHYYHLLSSSLQLSDAGKKIKEFIGKEKNIAIGQLAPRFSAADASGKTISIANYKGSCVLLEFWASWCKPCRAEHPFLKDVYTKYHQRGFDIIEISLDKKGNEEAWKEAIIKDKLPWLQIYDFKAWDNSIIKLYNVWGKGIPANFLIDPQGIIIDKNLRGNEVQKKIAVLIK